MFLLETGFVHTLVIPTLSLSDKIASLHHRNYWVSTISGSLTHWSVGGVVTTSFFCHFYLKKGRKLRGGDPNRGDKTLTAVLCWWDQLWFLGQTKSLPKTES